MKGIGKETASRDHSSYYTHIGHGVVGTGVITFDLPEVNQTGCTRSSFFPAASRQAVLANRNGADLCDIGDRDLYL